MEQKIISELLLEASQPDCASSRREEILNTFLSALPCYNRESNPEAGDVEHAEEEARYSTINQTLVRLFSQALEAKAYTKISALFPVFALYCGDRKANCIRATVDWNLVQ
jgi:hypothetical protein